MKPGRDLKSREQAIAEVKQVYAELEARPAERFCERRTECCQFKLTGKTPYLTAAEAMLVAKAMREAGINRLQDKKDGSCPLLHPENGRCLVYNDRPFACRTHFCQAAGGPYARREVVDLIRRLEDLDYAVGGRGPQTLPASVKEALERQTFEGRGIVSKAAPRSRGR